MWILTVASAVLSSAIGQRCVVIPVKPEEEYESEVVANRVADTWRGRGYSAKVRKADDAATK